MIKYKNYRG